MKKIKSLSLILILLLSLIFTFPVNTKALTSQTDLVSIENSENLTVGDLSFSNISFQDNSLSSSLAFGLTADVVNKSNSDIDYTATSYFYDSNYTLIANTSSSKFAVPDKSKLDQMSNLNILEDYTIEDIKYYRLEIETADFSYTNITPSKSDEYRSYDYVIDKYDIDIKVNENNTFDITETITAYFNVEKHGIYRKIPLKNKVVRLDGSTSTNRAKISNVSVDNEFQTSKSNGVYNIQIGSEDKTLTGEQTYTIKYTYDIGKDPVKNYDELYINIIGNEWDTVIGNVTFNITMPKEFDSSKLGFSSGAKGLTGNSNIKYLVSDNTITGSYNGILNPGEALTVRTELPEDYFVGENNNTSLQDYLIFIVPIIGLIISAILWYLYGRDNKVVETVEFYPPEGFNSLEIGFLYKGSADSTDVTSLLIYLADKGYIKIVETEEKSLFTKSKSFKIIKLKDYDGNNVNERLFLEGLFKDSMTEDEVNLSELYNQFYLTDNKILENVNSKENKQKIFEKKASSKKIFIVLMMIISYLLITAIPIINYGDSSNLIVALIFPAAGFSVLFGILLGHTPIATKIVVLIWGLGFGGVPWIATVLPAIVQETIYLIGYLIGIICLIGMAICLKFISKRTPYGLNMLGKIKGFKTYLETAEKNQLESMVSQNPNYFYDILPYTYVLGISDKWIKKFETITMQEPDWYVGTSYFSVAAFGSFMNTAMASANTAMSSSPSSGGSSGGGSSGGGSGGGGGGSW